MLAQKVANIAESCATLESDGAQLVIGSAGWIILQDVAKSNEIDQRSTADFAHRRKGMPTSKRPDKTAAAHLFLQLLQGGGQCGLLGVKHDLAAPITLGPAHFLRLLHERD